MQRPIIRQELRKISRAIMQKESKYGPYLIHDTGVIRLIERLIERIKLG
jgi:hypothetical protein